jgi:transcriptional regulator with XRE-family HTH domain
MGVMPQKHALTFTRADRLRKAREVAGLTQAQMADALGVDKKTIGRWETTGDVRALFLREWADLTDVDLDWLVGDEGLRGSIRPATSG